METSQIWIWTVLSYWRLSALTTSPLRRKRQHVHAAAGFQLLSCPVCNRSDLQATPPESCALTSLVGVYQRPAASPSVTAGCFVAAAAHFSTCWRHSHVDRLHIKRSSIQHNSKTTAGSGNVAVTTCSGHLDGGACLNQKRAGNVVVFTSEYQKLRFYLFNYKYFVLGFFCFFFRTLITLEMSSAFQAVGCRRFFRRTRTHRVSVS